MGTDSNYGVYTPVWFEEADVDVTPDDSSSSDSSSDVTSSDTTSSDTTVDSSSDSSDTTVDSSSDSSDTTVDSSSDSSDTTVDSSSDSSDTTIDSSSDSSDVTPDDSTSSDSSSEAPAAPVETTVDLNTIVTSNANGDSGYKNTYTTTSGWTTFACAIQTGKTGTDMNPQFSVIGPDNTHKAVCLNGANGTSATNPGPGTLTSPTLTGGLSKISFNYAKMFTDTKLSITIYVTDLATGTVYEETLAVELAKNDKCILYTYEWVLETPVSGDFTIQFKNNSPSNSSGNKDRITLWNIVYTSYAAGGDVTPDVPEVCTHEYDNDCDAECNLCQAIREVEGHKYDNDCDASCNNCNEIREVEGHKYEKVSADGVDTMTCACGDTYTFNTAITDERQEFEVLATNAKLTMTGCSEYASVESIKVGEISLGNDIASLDLTTLALIENRKFHGEQNVIVTVLDANNIAHEITVPALIVTKYIATTADFEATMNFSEVDVDGNGAVASGEKGLLGYYVQTANIGSENLGAGQPWKFGATATADAYGGRGNPQPEYYGYGFRGIYDGRGYEILGRSFNGGLFGLLGNNAVVKNLTITDVYAAGTRAKSSLLADFAGGAKIQNVTFKYRQPSWAPASSLPANPEANQYCVGWLVGISAYALTFTDCKIDAADYDFYALFGSGWYAGYEHTTTDKNPTEKKNTYTNFEINVKSLRYIGYWYEGSTSGSALGTFHGVTVADEIAAGEGIIMPIAATLSTRQAFSVASESIALDLGDYATGTISSITYGSYDLGTDASKIVLPEALKADKQSHGEQNVIVTMMKDDTKVVLTVPVTFVTAYIATADDFRTYVQPTKIGNTAVYGYYVQTADFTDTALATQDYAWDATYGFFGTYDGDGHYIHTASNKLGGIFSILRGATIKNLTLKDGWHSTTCALIARAAYGATLENITVQWLSGNINTNTGANSGSWLFAAEFSNGTVNGLTITAVPHNDTTVHGTIFGNKFNNNKVTNLSITGYTGEVGYDTVNSKSVMVADLVNA